jgi:hypothetical protein
MVTMRLYLVECGEDAYEYDTAVSAVVWADTPAEAKTLFSKIRYVARGPYTARPVRLGKPRVIHTHFNAG